MNLVDQNQYDSIKFFKNTYLDYHELRQNTSHTESNHSDSNQGPKPYREFSQCSLILCEPNPKINSNNLGKTFFNLGANSEDLEKEIDINLISQVLKYSVAVSAWKKVSPRHKPFALRVNPSCGNLHPTEVYISLKNSDHDFLSHYNVLNHCLEKRLQPSIQALLAQATGYSEIANSEAVFIVNAIYGRQIWKYGQRGYRYSLLDAGHTAMSIMLAAAAQGLAATAICDFPDQAIASILGLQNLDEDPLFIIAIGKKMKTWNWPSLKPESLPNLDDFTGIANVIHLEGESRSEISKFESSLYYDVADLYPPLQTQFNTHFPEKLKQLLSLFHINSRKRRSALAFPNKAQISKDELDIIMSLFELNYYCDFLGSSCGQQRRSLLNYYVLVNRSEHLETGLYKYNQLNGKLEQIRKGANPKELAYLCVEQAHLENASITIFMTGDFEKASELGAQRGFRHLHFEAGMLGQLLYLSAESLGLIATGISAFYDAELNSFLDINHAYEQCLYAFALG